MPKVWMFPNPRYGQVSKSGHVITSKFMADYEVAKNIAGVHAVVGQTARTIAIRATARLMTVKAMSEYSKGPKGSEIVTHRGFIDHYVALSDERDQNAAGAIEKEHGILESATLKGRADWARDPRDLNFASTVRPPGKGWKYDHGIDTWYPG